MKTKDQLTIRLLHPEYGWVTFSQLSIRQMEILKDCKLLMKQINLDYIKNHKKKNYKFKP